MKTTESEILFMYVFNETQTLVLKFNSLESGGIKTTYSVYLLDTQKGNLGIERFKEAHKAKHAFDIRKNCVRPDIKSKDIELILLNPYDPSQHYFKLKRGI